MKKIKIIKKETVETLKKVYDVSVKDAAHYFLENGVISHNTGSGYVPTKEASGGLGAIFSASIIPFLSKAQLKEGDTKTGIIVTSKLKKSRFTIPRDIKFHISFYKGMNKYVGLEEFISWDSCGIEKGSLLTLKEYEKQKDKDPKASFFKHKYDEINEKTGEVKTIEEELVFIPKETARTFVVKHLGSTIYPKDLFSDKIFTQEVLKNLDDNIIKKYFELPSQVDGNDDMEELFEEEINSEE